MKAKSIVCGFLSIFQLQTVCTEYLENCKPLALAVKQFDDELNDHLNGRFLRKPAEYREIAEKCEEVINCIRVGDPERAEEHIARLGVCQFYIFYSREFASCGYKLLAKKDERITCLDFLFNDYDELNESGGETCKLWDSLQPCILDQIDAFCAGEEPQIRTRFEQEVPKFRDNWCSVRQL